jgi:hypothetical protein
MLFLGGFLGIDRRAIASLRIALALIVLYDLARRSVLHPGDLKALHTLDGIVPPDLTPHHAFIHKLMFYRGNETFQAIIFLMHSICAVCLGLGIYPRISGFLSWILFACLNGRNEYVIDCGDRLTRNLLFWIWQLPAAGLHTWSVTATVSQSQSQSQSLSPSSQSMTRELSVDSDSKASTVTVTAAKVHTSFSTASIYLQFFALYWCTLAFRLPGTTWYGDWSATWLALHHVAFATPVANLLTQVPNLSLILHGTVVFFEAIGPLIVLFSFSMPHVRMISVMMFWAMQFGFGCCLRLELFPLVSAAMMLAFVPSLYWNKFARLISKSSPPPVHVHVTKLNKTVPMQLQSNVDVQSQKPGLRQRNLIMAKSHTAAVHPPVRSVDAIATSATHKSITPPSVILRIWSGFFLCYIIMLNLGDLDLVTKPDNGDIGEALRINQMWVMFSPDPPPTSGWVVAEGTLSDGTSIDMLHAIKNSFHPDLSHHQPASYEPPATPAYVYRTFRWQKYFSEVAQNNDINRLWYITHYLCREWNHAKSQSPALVAVKYTYMIVRAPPMHHNINVLDPTRNFLGDYRCAST